MILAQCQEGFSQATNRKPGGLKKAVHKNQTGAPPCRLNLTGNYQIIQSLMRIPAVGVADGVTRDCPAWTKQFSLRLPQVDGWIIAQGAIVSVVM